MGVATGVGEAHSGPKSIRTSVPPQAPTHLDEPAGRILEVPVRVLGLALALPSTSFFSNYEVFIAERQFAKSETQLIKLVYESRPTQRRLSEYGVDVATTYKLRVKRDPSCDETGGADHGRSLLGDAKLVARCRIAVCRQRQCSALLPHNR